MRVRVVDDDLLIAEMVAAGLTMYEIDVVTTTGDFAALIDTRPWEGVEAAIVDMMLGSTVSGETILRYLYDHHPHVRRILFSAVGELGVIPQELPDVVITKPAAIGLLVEAVSAAG